MSNLVERTEAPKEDNRYFYADNPFYKSGMGLPNCTAYAWGRFYEATNQKPALSMGNAGDWFAYNDGYRRGKAPKIGAIICWGPPVDMVNGSGHVGFVERVNEDGTIITSESSYGGEYFWRRKLRYNDGSWSGGNYVFQGFIYSPISFDGVSNISAWLLAILARRAKGGLYNWI